VISAYDPADNELAQQPIEGARGWLVVVAPTDAERAKLVELGVPEELVHDALDADEMSHVDHHETGAKLFVLRVPVTVGAEAEVVPLGVVTLADGRVVVICATDTAIPEMLVGDKAAWTSPTTFMLRTAAHVAERFVKTLRAIDAKVEALEIKLRRALQNDEILGLLAYQKRLVHLVTALSANQLVLERALEDERLALSEPERILVEDVLVEIRQAAAMARTQKELLGETMDALATVVSNNLNVAMKKLASMTLLVSVPALLAALYGMNVRLPLEHHPQAFYIVLAVAAAAMAALGVFLRAHRWL
jgi:magnesium transporter